MPADPKKALLASALERLARALAATQRSLGALRRTVDRASAGPPDPGALVELEAALLALRAAPAALAQELDTALRQVRWLRLQASRDRQVSFSRELHEAARRRRLLPRLLSDHPEQWRLGALTLHVDRPRDAAELRYARAPVATDLPCDAPTILRAWRQAQSELARGSLAPEDFLPALFRAYEAVLAKGARAAGERVALCDLLARLRRSRRGYSRAQFPYDLARLRRERRLSYRGHRIDLGVATGQSTEDPERVVFIEDDAGAGQYYLYFRMVPEAAPKDRDRESGDDAQDGRRDAARRTDAAARAQDPQPDGRKRQAARARRLARERRQRDVPAAPRSGLHRGPHRPG